MSILSMLRRKQSVGVATVISAIPATHGPELAGAVARIATIAVANSTEAENDGWNSSRNSNNSSSKPCEQKATCWRWLIHFADRNPAEVAFSPEATHAEVLDFYPSALAAEPVTELRQGSSVLASLVTP